MSGSAEQLVNAFAVACARRGLDLVAPFSVSAFNSAASVEERLPDLARQDALAILVGNTRRLWPVFRAALAEDPSRREVAHPLDRYVTESVTDAASTTGVHHELRWAHTMLPHPIPIQRMAQQIGLAALSPSHLSVHPTFGPWIALRAVAVFDVAVPAPAERPSIEPCVSCAKPCVAALEKALGAAGPRPLDEIHIGSDWERWLAVRDACPVGISHRYSDDQIAYHYTKSAKLL